MSDTAAPTAPMAITPWTLFYTFASMGLQGFGGVMAWARRILVEDRGWVDNREFTELLALSQILPGPNICNLASILGYRWCGVRGACAAVVGLLGPSGLIVLGLGALYEHYQNAPGVEGAVHGMTAVAVGLVFAAGVKLAQSQPRNVRGPVLGIAALIAVAALHWPLVWVLGALIPLALVLEWRSNRSPNT